MPLYSEDPHIRLQGWGGNIRHSNNNLDIDSYLLGYYNQNTLDYTKNPKIKTTLENTKKMEQITDESRATHPAREYRSVKVDRFNYLFENPQNHYKIPFAHNVDSKEIAKKEYMYK